MKSILFLLLIIAISGFPVVSQHVRQSLPLPAGIARWSGKDSGRILDTPVIKSRLKAPLGKKNYAAFMESFESLTPIEKKGKVLFSSGCLIHACTQLESAVAIDLVRGTIHAAIFRRNE